ncbi:cyclin, N-terminal domain containing protein [Entamoeba nuttalli P19]|uniref:Cyclin, N-terminal domain containing protein n=1 Tax=Entamoeba nuttalli (strain P19) TaxID=1076696 RepID=K2HZY8_ENTNP|nr:cyclin, N-terminal domain containing protein [Entamoeba nuttalli P19]EKE42040.1 cyclin, N-terminal domain containing protein [Entamoeba nuttalli P19]|eukprot:XP_008855625.1 cyclin, N-terminal domain containing protein [Entamoeba nuttalli P19]
MQRQTESLVYAPSSKRGTEKMSETNILQPNIQSNIRDIDSFDCDDPFFMTTYAKDIFKYLKEEEELTIIPTGFMTGQLYITPKMRQKLVDWIAEISTVLTLLSETYLLTIYIIDKYLSLNKTVERNNFQLVGVAAVLIASKFEEYSYVIVSDLVTLTGDAYTADMIKNMECQILNTLNFQIIRPTPLDFLRRFSRAADNTEKPHITARYLIELATLDYQLMEKKVSLLAAASVYLGRKMCETTPFWDETMAFYSGYSEQDLLGTARCLNILHKFTVCSKSSNYLKIKEKFEDEQHKFVSLLPPCADF